MRSVVARAQQAGGEQSDGGKVGLGTKVKGMDGKVVGPSKKSHAGWERVAAHQPTQRKPAEAGIETGGTWVRCRTMPGSKEEGEEGGVRGEGFGFREREDGRHGRRVPVRHSASMLSKGCPTDCTAGCPTGCLSSRQLRRCGLSGRQPSRWGDRQQEAWQWTATAV